MKALGFSLNSSRTSGCCCRYSCSAGWFSTHAVLLISEGSLRSCSAISGWLSRNRSMLASFPPVEAFLPPHESGRVLAELLPDFRMLLQIFLQSGMVLNPLFVVDQRRILAQLFRDLRMAVQEPVHARQFPPGRVIVLRVLGRHRPVPG